MNLSRISKRQLVAMNERQVSAILFEAKLRAEHAVSTTWFHLSTTRPQFNVAMMERMERAQRSMEIARSAISVLMGTNLTEAQREMIAQFLNLRQRAMREAADQRSKWFAMKVKFGMWKS